MKETESNATLVERVTIEQSWSEMRVGGFRKTTVGRSGDSVKKIEGNTIRKFKKWLREIVFSHIYLLVLLNYFWKQWSFIEFILFQIDTN